MRFDSKLVKLDMLINGDKVDALASIVHREVEPKAVVGRWLKKMKS